MDEKFERPILSVDVVPLTIQHGALCLLRTVRNFEPFAGTSALIGGFVRADEDDDLGATARRVLKDKAGLERLYIEQLSTFSGSKRDPRGWSASVAYFSLTPLGEVEAALNKIGLQLIPVEQAKGMPFDHDLILDAALQRLRGRGAYSNLPAKLLPPGFTLAELHHTYELVLGENINGDAFRRKVLQRDMLEPTGEKRRSAGAAKPSILYRLRGRSTNFDRRF